MKNYKSLREACCIANRQLPELGLVDLTFGNVSVFDKTEDVFAIKASGIPYRDLKDEHCVIVDRAGKVVFGTLNPSSDTPTHRRLFEAFASLGITSIVHTHSRKAVAFAQAGIEIPCLGTTHADHFNGAIPLTREMTAEEISSDYEWETGNVIVERFKALNPAETPAVLVRNHGPFAWGNTPDKALENALALEIIADMALNSCLLNPRLENISQALLNKHFFRKHGATAYYGQLQKG